MDTWDENLRPTYTEDEWEVADEFDQEGDVQERAEDVSLVLQIRVQNGLSVADQCRNGLENNHCGMSGINLDQKTNPPST